MKDPKAQSVQACLGLAAVDGAGPTPSQRAMVLHSIRDAVAVAVAGADQRSVVAATNYVDATGSTGPAWIWGTGRRVDPVSAAFVNGTMVQALDFDDIAPLPAAHMSSVVVPTVAALSHLIEADRAVDGVVQGLRLARILSGLISRDAYRRGLQPTHTIGAAAAVAAAGYALGLAPDRISEAIGLACIQAIGLRAHTGTPSKAMQSGLAAAAAVRALMLVVAGTSSGSAALDALLSLFGVSDEALAVAAATTTADPLELAVKLYPSCGGAHSAIEATLALRRALHPNSDPPTAMSVHLPPRVPNAMPFIWPGNADEARFSLHYCVATAWRRGAVEIDDFSEEAILGAPEGPPAWLKIAADETFDPQGEQCDVSVEAAGQRLSHHIEYREGYPERPLSSGRIYDKAFSCFERVYGRDRAGGIMQSLSGDNVFSNIGPSTTPEVSAP